GAVDDTVAFAKERFRNQTTGAGLGPRLAKSWRGSRFPRGAVSMGAAGNVFSKADRIVAAFSKGAGETIRSGNGFYLAIPTEAAPKRGDNRKRISPSNFPEWKLGPLRFVPLPRGRGMLVVDNQRASISRKTGQVRGFRPASKRARETGVGLATVIMFFLVPQIRLKRAFNIEAVQRSGDEFLLRSLERHFRLIDDGVDA
ncbi:MAG: DUF6441 family protein, partial [Parvibaculum sp.]